MIRTGLISVIMSTYNTNSKYLLTAVKSILGQTYKNLECIVIVDGGNYDSCLSVIKDERLKIIVHHGSMGLAARLNEAILMAEGEYIARMDSDDYSLPDRLEKQYKFMKKHTEIDICGMFASKFGGEVGFLINANTTDKYIETELFLNSILLHPTIMFRKSAILKYNIKYNENFKYAQDYELWSRLCGVVKFAIVPKVGLLYRVHDEQISKSKRKKQIEFRDKIIKRNMHKLGLSVDDFKYIEMLIGSNSNLDFDGLTIFVRKILESNKKLCVYDQRGLKDVIYRHIFVVLLRNRKFGLSIKYLRPYIVCCIFKKKFFVFYSKIKIHRYLNQCKKEGDLI